MSQDVHELRRGTPPQLEAHATPQAQAPVRVCVVGAGSRFLSGISYYTHGLITALAESHEVSAILIRQMMPTRLYPGREHVGRQLAELDYPDGVRILDGIDWYWGTSIVRAVALIRQERPAVIVLQWWTGTVLHSYLLLAVLARRLGIRVVVEFHETLDTGELRMPLVRRYVAACSPLLMALADGFAFHNEHDRRAIAAQYALGDRPTAIVPHGPYDQYGRAPARARRPGDVCRLLYFGVIRPFKGVEDIVAALDQMPEDVAARFHLTVVGETWEGWSLPAERIAASPNRDRISFVNRYVTDVEVSKFFAAADVVVLPYHRSSSSGPLHLAMACGLPVVVSAVGGLTEACRDYGGAVMVKAQDPAALREGLERSYSLRAQRFADESSWQRTVSAHDALFRAVHAGAAPVACD